MSGGFILSVHLPAPADEPRLYWQFAGVGVTLRGTCGPIRANREKVAQWARHDIWTAIYTLWDAGLDAEWHRITDADADADAAEVNRQLGTISVFGARPYRAMSVLDSLPHD